MHKENTEKNPSISLMRVLATLMVLMTHFGQSLPTIEPIHAFIIYGGNGVVLFYVISGYVIASSISRNEDLKIFYAKRFIRIVPMVYTVIIINALAGAVIGNYPMDTMHIGWVRYFCFINTILPSNDWVYWNNCSALWTIPGFLLFYFIAPFMHRYINNDSDLKHVNHNMLKILWGG